MLYNVSSKHTAPKYSRYSLPHTTILTHRTTNNSYPSTVLITQYSAYNHLYYAFWVRRIQAFPEVKEPQNLISILLFQTISGARNLIVSVSLLNLGRSEAANVEWHNKFVYIPQDEMNILSRIQINVIAI